MSTEVVVAPASELGEASPEPHERWSQEKANTWYNQRPWMVGCNYIPASASNQLEMWQAETFDAERIDTELGWAAHLGFNSVRVFLHDMVWGQDAQGLSSRIDRFLCIAAKHGIDTLFVLFDSCWNPHPHLGPQEPPLEGIHNSRWVQSPGSDALSNPDCYPRLKKYVVELLSGFKDDPRIIGWDLWNEPDNDNAASYPTAENADKLKLVGALLPQVFDWARSANSSQPLTSAVWFGKWSNSADITPIQRTQIECSDVLSFHNYEGAAKFKACIKSLEPYGRPLLCTEYMARMFGSTFQDILPIAKARRVAAFNWGLVSGKTQTRFPWTTWQVPPKDGQEPEWFHEILREDGSPYRIDEVKAICRLTKGDEDCGASAPRSWEKIER